MNQCQNVLYSRSNKTVDRRVGWFGMKEDTSGLGPHTVHRPRRINWMKDTYLHLQRGKKYKIKMTKQIKGLNDRKSFMKPPLSNKRFSPFQGTYIRTYIHAYTHTYIHTYMFYLFGALYNKERKLWSPPPPPPPSPSLSPRSLLMNWSGMVYSYAGSSNLFWSLVARPLMSCAYN